MNFIWDKITEWLKGLLVSGIISNLSGLFDAINTRVGEAAAVVGTTPQAWHGGIFQMIRSLSENVVVPIAGIILTFIMCLELIQMLIDRNSLLDLADEVEIAGGIENIDRLAVPDKIHKRCGDRAVFFYFFGVEIADRVAVCDLT